MDGGMIVALDLVGQGKVGWIEYAGIRPEELEEPRSFLDCEARKGTLS